MRSPALRLNNPDGGRDFPFVERQKAHTRAGMIIMKVLFKHGIQTLCWITAVTSPVASAATYEEMQRLDAAYPPGSVVVCRSDLPGDGSVQPTTIMTVRGTVISQTKGLTTYDISATWAPEGSNGMTLTYRMSQRSDRTGQYSRIDPASMSVSMPAAGPEGEKTVLEEFRSRLATGVLPTVQNWVFRNLGGRNSMKLFS